MNLDQKLLFFACVILASFPLVVRSSPLGINGCPLDLSAVDRVISIMLFVQNWIVFTAFRIQSSNGDYGRLTSPFCTVQPP